MYHLHKQRKNSQLPWHHGEAGSGAMKAQEMVSRMTQVLSEVLSLRADKETPSLPDIEH